jgi:hypothetical protein
MISYVDLQSVFELADDNEDGLITEEAIEAAVPFGYLFTALK